MLNLYDINQLTNILTNSHQRNIIKYALLKTGMADTDVEDALGDLIIKAYEKAHLYDATRGASITTWLTGFALDIKNSMPGKRRCRNKNGFSLQYDNDAVDAACDQNQECQTPESILIAKRMATELYQNLSSRQALILDTLGGDSYNSGIQVTSVNLQDAQPPEQVQNAFADAIKAREDEQRLINEAQAYANDVIPKARGAAARKTQEAEGYKEQVIAQAQGETSRFSQLLTEYTKAPDVTRKRLYIDAMESVLSSTNNVIVDVKNGNNMMYLPLDKMIPPQNSANAAPVVNAPHVSSTTAEPPQQPTAPQNANMPISVPSLEHSIRGRQNDMRGR